MKVLKFLLQFKSAKFVIFFRLIRRYIVPNFVILQVKGVTLKFKGKLLLHVGQDILILLSCIIKFMGYI